MSQFEDASDAVSPEDEKSWQRARFQPTGQPAVLFYLLYGDFPEPLVLSSGRYRTPGLPPGALLQHYGAGDLCGPALLESPIGRVLRQGHAVRAAAASPACLVLHGELPESSSMSYLWDVVGVITCLLENGGAAVVDMLAFAAFTPAEWRERFFNVPAFDAQRHVTVLVSEEATPPNLWLHTRGMRKFGRPDVSLRQVPLPLLEAAQDLCFRFIELFGDGGAPPPEGQPLRIPGLPPGLTCHIRTDFDDPDFNNAVVEVVFPAEPTPAP